MRRNQAPLIAIIATFIHSTSTTSGDVAVVEGDVSIAGLFEIHTKKGEKCGPINTDSVMVLEATRWYIEQLNEHKALPFKLGFEGYETCGLPRVAVERTLDIQCSYKNFNRTGDSGNLFLGIIGPSRSEESALVAEALNLGAKENSFLQISVSATATPLGDRNIYPNFYRVIPDDSKQIETMILLMKELQWNRIAIMYEDNLYCKTCIQSLAENAQQNLICVSKELAISVSEDGDVSVDEINTYLQEIMLQSPVIGGVILFASREVAYKVLYAVDSKGVADVPVFILSESVGLQNDVFMSNGVVMPKTKGSMSVSAPYTEITTFTDYWSSLMTNITLLKEKLVLNPWLNELFVSISNCDPALAPSCQGLSMEETEIKFPIQPVYLRYGILAAHTMAKAILQLYNKLCSANSLDCLADFMKDFKPYMLTDEIKNLSVDFSTDFPGVSVEPLTSSQYKMTFGNLAGPISVSDLEFYQVYNYRQRTAGNGNGEFVLFKVGNLTEDHQLYIDLDAIRDYTSDGTEIRFPNLRRGQCPAQQKCAECIKQNIPDLFIHVPGDLYVIGIVPVNNIAASGALGCGSVRSRDGYQLALALQYGIEKFNTSIGYFSSRNKFGDKKIGLIVLNSCYNNFTIARKILDLQVNGLTLENGKHLDLTDRILGYVGGLASWASVSAATQLTTTKHVLVSYGSTYPTLSDKELFPYFLRIVSSDSVEAEAMMEIVKAVKGEYIQVVYNECSCGSARKRSIESMARKHGICVAQYIEVKNRDTYFEYYEILRKKPHAKLVIIFLSPHILNDFMRDLNQQMQKGEFQFLGSEAWGGNSDLLQYDTVKGALCVTMQLDEDTGLRTYIQKKVPTRHQYDPWLEQYLQKRQDCYFDWSHDKTFSRQCTDDILPPAQDGYFQPDSWCPFATNTLLALLMGTSEFFTKSCGSSSQKLCSEYTRNPTGLYDEMKRISMDISGTGAIKLFDSVGDGNMGFQIYNVKQEDSNKNVLMFSKVGRYSIKTGLDMYAENVVFPTAEPIISSCPNEQACQGCSDKALEEKQPEPESTSAAGMIVLGVLVGILVIAVVALTCILVYVKRKTKEDPYLTPSADMVRPEAVGKSESPYHSAEKIQETSY